MNGSLKLTKELLRAGYSFDRPEELPNGVKIGDGMDSGEFVYLNSFVWEKTYKLPCGKLVKGSKLFDGLSANGKEYRFENSNPLILCPIAYKGCGNQSGEFKNNTAVSSWCVAAETSEAWNYENSFERMKDREEARKKKLRHEFLSSHPRSCKNQIVYEAGEWKDRYNFELCTSLCGSGCHYCPVSKGPLSRKKANVFYNIKITGTDPALKGSLFEGEESISISKGNRFFNSPISVDLCERFVKSFSFRIREKEERRRFSDIFFAEIRGETLKVEIEDIRVEQRESRDLLQDLEDIKNGISVFHALDLEKAEKIAKSERRKKAQEKKEKKKVRLENESKQISLFDTVGG